METNYSISRPELLTVTQDGHSWRGADQLWYHDDWQQKAGCGPTTASMMASYLAQTRRDCASLYPSGSWEQGDVIALMEEMWNFVTPGKHGVNTTHLFVKGLTAFAAGKGVTLPLRELDIPRLRLARPTMDQCAAFLRSSLNADQPVAWLNLHRGEVEALDDWHWVIVIALEERRDGTELCTILDGGREYAVDFRLWFQTTKLGGGLVAPGSGI